MLTMQEILETIKMVQEEHLDIRTITMGVSIRDCAHENPKIATQKIYDKITRLARRLVPVGEELEREFGIPIVNKRISVTPIALVAGRLKQTITLCLPKLWIRRRQRWA